MEKCKFALREKNRSVLCDKLGQWVSEKYCRICCFYEKALCNNHAMLFHNYNYNIAISNNRGKTGENTSSHKNSSLTFSGEKVSWV